MKIVAPFVKRAVIFNNLSCYRLISKQTKIVKYYPLLKVKPILSALEKSNIAAIGPLKWADICYIALKFVKFGLGLYGA